MLLIVNVCSSVRLLKSPGGISVMELLETDSTLRDVSEEKTPSVRFVRLLDDRSSTRRLPKPLKVSTGTSNNWLPLKSNKRRSISDANKFPGRLVSWLPCRMIVVVFTNGSKAFGGMLVIVNCSVAVKLNTKSGLPYRFASTID